MLLGVLNWKRLARQTIVLGRGAQETISEKTVTVVGAGGVGSHSALLCAQLGVGEIKIIDGDRIEESNISRLALSGVESIGKNKAVDAVDQLKKIDSAVRARAMPFFLSEKNAGIIDSADLVLDCTDNFVARLLINRRCWSTRRPWIYGGAIRSEAMTSTIIPRKTPCFECWAKPPRDIGVTAPAPALAAAVQASEAVNVFLGRPALAGKLFYADLSRGVFGKRRLAKRKDCFCRK